MATEIEALTPDQEFDKEFDALLANTVVKKDVDEGEPLETAKPGEPGTVADAKVVPPVDKVATEFFADDDETPEAKKARETAEAAAKELADKADAEINSRVTQELAVRRALADDAAKEADAKAAAVAAAKAANDQDLDKLIAGLEMPAMTAEQKTAWAAFEQANPDAAKQMTDMLELHGKTIAVQFTKALATVVARVNEMAAPLQEQGNRIAFNEHMGALRAAHEDYDKLVSNTGADKKGPSAIQAWINTQPAFLQTAMNRVYSEGDTSEMLDLVTQFKQATGKVVAPQVLPDQPGNKGKTRADQAAIDALKPVVGSKRTAPVMTGVDTNDFDGAFAEFTADHEQQQNSRRK